jgi:serpin B
MIATYNTLGRAIFRTLSAPRMVQWRGRERREPAGNVVISPLSIGVTLAMGFAASAGETAEEMARALGFDTPRSDLLEANADLLRHYGEADAPEGFRLRLANALVLTQHGDAVAKSYRDLLADSFAAEIFEGDVARVNQWVAQKTEGKIERVLADLPQDDIAVLVNAVYFKAPWAEAFDPTLTHDGLFFLSGESRSSMMEGDGIEVAMMHAVRDFVIVQGTAYRAARLPYKPPSLGMIIVLPDPIEGLGYIEALDAVQSVFDADEITRLRAEFERQTPSEFPFYMPRFRVRSEASLKPGLQRAGMTLAFDWTRADFSGMTERPPSEIPVAISDVVHCAVIEVSEEGTEAAGATLVSFHIGGIPPSFVVDRPFLFFIVDDTTGAILFQGRIVDPR